MQLYALREEYVGQGLALEDLAADPVDQFERWFKQACDAMLLEPNAMIVSTVGKDLRPSSRTVLLKSFDIKGFVFFTNYQSAKARQMAENPWVSLLFPWLGLARQCIVRGEAKRVSAAENLQYFMSRPLASRLGAWASPQSQVISSRAVLEAKFNEIRDKFAQGDVPLPSFWGGYRVRPETFEFWQGRPNRLHDRFLYTRIADGWTRQCLAP